LVKGNPRIKLYSLRFSRILNHQNYSNHVFSIFEIIFVFSNGYNQHRFWEVEAAATDVFVADKTLSRIRIRAKSLLLFYRQFV
jgi:hypothetical protein